eukprot:CAMPEP_0203753488 /NCGR_PEP_ID=MMETSP0098-20131031/7241_1 /ASSEMBLY_ACC=CAM_ASM_000208 /TAXON_ID=96639 /ORGANISM=" , Strain NY0313808BC1" /LENGTH=677 /DNA_ID=CAMNT_0050644107 /DNA_START=118 /DNA_END=2151 /DNA_ORIENTATION=+
MSSKERQLNSFYERLGTYVSKGQNSKAVIVCDKILKAQDDESKLPPVLKTKCVCLIRQDKIEAALQLATAQDLLCEKAYCLYKKKENQAALDVLNAADEDFGLAGKNLKAQLLYRTGDYQGATDIYQELVDSAQGGASTELVANFIAASVLGGSSQSALDKLGELDTVENYELVYNKACALISLGQTQSATQTLDQAINMGSTFLETDNIVSSADIDSELALLRVQKAYALHILDGEFDDSHVQSIIQMYVDGLATNPQDGAVAAVAANNLLALRGDHDLFDSYKRMRATVSFESLARLPKSYEETVLLNKALLLLKMQKSSECRSLLDEIRKRFPKSSQPALIEGSLLLREKKQDKCIEYFEKLANDDAIFVCALMQICLSQGDSEGAIKVVERFPRFKLSPEIVKAVVSVYEYTGAVDKAEGYLSEVCSECSRSNSIVDSRNQIPLALLRGDFLLRTGKYEQAAGLYVSVMSGKLGPVEGDTRMIALANYVIATSYYDQEASQSKAEALSLPADIHDIDVESLENNPTFSNASWTRKVQTPRSPSASISMAISPSGEPLPKKIISDKSKKKRDLKKRTKRREEYLQKLVEKMGSDFDLSKNKPDPERWVPKNMREKAIRARKKRGGKLVGAQGIGDISTRDAQKLDARLAAKTKEEQAARPAGARKAKKKKKGRR